jgi:hypothetical protein
LFSKRTGTSEVVDELMGLSDESESFPGRVFFEISVNTCGMNRD